MTDEVLADMEGEGVGWQPEAYSLPRAAAVNNLATGLSGRGLSVGAVEALARAAVQPDDMRRKLADVNRLRVQGGTLHIVETRLWSASVVPHPANPREYGHRSYALGSGAASPPRVLLEPESVLGGGPELQLRVAVAADLAQRLVEAEDRLVKDNPLADDIAVEGVLQPLTVVCLTAHHTRDAIGPTPLLIAADGSSRISSVHQLLDYTPAVIAYQWGRDFRLFRREVNRWLRLAQKQGWDALSPAEQGKVRALTVPARVVVGFDPDARTGVRFHTAVRNFIGLTHIRPPKPYSSAAEDEAKGDAVLDFLAEPMRSRRARITPQEKRWYAGLTTEAEAAAEGFSPHRDVRAMEIVRGLLGGGTGTARRVNEGIRSLTAQQRPTHEERVDIAVELVLRPVRTEKSDLQSYVRPRRAILQRAFRLPEIKELSAEGPLEGASGGSSLEDLRDAALKEASEGLGAGGGMGPAQTELAVKAAYYMATAEPMALQREGSGAARDEDGRTAGAVLRAMLSRPHGIVQAYEVVRAGRLRKPLLEVDADGAPVRTAEGTHRQLTDALLRHTYNGEVLAVATAGLPAVRMRWAVVQTSVLHLKQAVQAMEAVPTHEGGVMTVVGREGWETKGIARVRGEMDWISRRLASWADTYADAHPDPQDDTDGDGDTSPW
ncbi:hypothetical protein ACFWJT_22275 [Streptomyces sp. NPDC127069]|uniref:hypothetical protein n=1 Tax=Streptomyces sp. NPDC127069 TaxID=3347128 RepID=UPI0036651DA1